MTPEQHAAIIRTLEKPMADAYLADVRAANGDATVAEIERFLERGDNSGIVALLSVGGLSLFTELVRTAFISGARNEYPRFDTNTWDVNAALMQLFQGIKDDWDYDLRRTLWVIGQEGGSYRQQAVDLLGVRSGSSPFRTGGMFGMYGDYTQYVYNARRQLRSSNPAQLRDYLNRRNRDTAYDNAVKRIALRMEESRKAARQAGMPETTKPAMPVKEADKVAKAYAKKMSEKNAARIAQHWAATAYNAGRYQSIKQQIDSGLIAEGDVTKRWNTMRDEGVRHSHSAMQGQRRSFRDPFVSGQGGRLQFPCDRSLGARDDDIYGCRCSVEYTVRRRG